MIGSEISRGRRACDVCCIRSFKFVRKGLEKNQNNQIKNFIEYLHSISSLLLIDRSRDIFQCSIDSIFPNRIDHIVCILHTHHSSSLDQIGFIVFFCKRVFQLQQIQIDQDEKRKNIFKSDEFCFLLSFVLPLTAEIS